MSGFLDFNSFDSSRLNAFKESPVRQRDRYLPTSAYYKLDAGGVDSLGGHDLTNTGAVGTTTGKFGNAAIFHPTSFYSSASEDFEWSGISWMVRFWVWLRDYDFLGGDYDVPVDTLLGRQWSIRTTGVINNPTAETTLFLFVQGAGSLTTTAKVQVSDTERWDRIICWHDTEAGEIGVKINDGASETVAVTQPMTEVEGVSFSLSSLLNVHINDVGFLLDDVCLVCGRVWNHSEMSRDWQGGAGRTFPDVPEFP